MFKIILLLSLTLPSLHAQRAFTPEEANQKFDKALQFINQARFDKANFELVPLQMALQKEFEVKPGREIFERSRQITDGLAALSTLAHLRGQYEAKNWQDASETSWILSFGLSTLWRNIGAQKRFEILTQDVQTLKGDERESARRALLITAVEARLWQQARSVASEIIAAPEKQNESVYMMTNGGNRHLAYTVSGIASLAEGNSQEAAKQLLASAKTGASLMLRGQGPNMRLAEELLAAGEKAPVLEYLKLLESWAWREGNRLEDWRKQIEAGKTPDFSRWTTLH